MRYRRIALKASVPLWTGCALLGLTFPTADTALGQFSPFGQPGAVAPSTAGTSNSGVAASGDPRQQSEKLLGQARKAIKEGNFELAESQIVQAEKLGAKYNSLEERVLDTPPKLRKLLAQERVKAGASARLPAQPPGTTIPGDPY